eukprot:gnl/MRDRNA2_/MRDRNA2_188516_c0_seq1.p1 gnl/MRDRNA2_/MRDRNA2_188516_c0~~gnl/MRDRNA2_/MRDRNA2_188516_c0_seq1.p1  ORF type:complete len:401 (-),score=87.75 gnl/MRDRNA2_/MRDRNA2_188516_c0_seq1:121-1323(-)
MHAGVGRGSCWRSAVEHELKRECHERSSQIQFLKDVHGHEIQLLSSRNEVLENRLEQERELWHQERYLLEERLKEMQNQENKASVLNPRLSLIEDSIASGSCNQRACERIASEVAHWSNLSHNLGIRASDVEAKFQFARHECLLSREEAAGAERHVVDLASKLKLAESAIESWSQKSTALQSELQKCRNSEDIVAQGEVVLRETLERESSMLKMTLDREASILQQRGQSEMAASAREQDLLKNCSNYREELLTLKGQLAVAQQELQMSQARVTSTGQSPSSPLPFSTADPWFQQAKKERLQALYLIESYRERQERDSANSTASEALSRSHSELGEMRFKLDQSEIRCSELEGDLEKTRLEFSEVRSAMEIERVARLVQPLSLRSSSGYAEFGWRQPSNHF